MGSGGGGLNILRHKSWHVYDKNNIERVKKDEENARKASEEKQRRSDIAVRKIVCQIIHFLHHIFQG
jgi:hypothetical protein